MSMASDNDVAAKLAFLFALCSLYSQILCSSKISNLRLCGSRDCEEIISYARAVRPLRSNDPAFLSFEEGDTIYIYSKSAGRKPYLWGGQVNGLRGYFPMSFVKEYQVLIKNPLSVVITENYQLEKPVVTMEEKDETDLEEEEENDDEADDIKITELNTVTKTEKKDLVNEPKSTVDTTDIDSDVDGKLEVKNSLVSTKPPNEDSEIQDETDFEETAIKVDVETERDAASESENQELNKALHEKSKETKDAAAASVDKRIEELTQSFHHLYLEKNARKSDNLINEAESTNGNANSVVNGELENPPEEKNSKKIASNGNMDVTTDSKMKSDEGEKDADEKSVEKMDITAIEKKISEENKTDEKLKIEAPNRQVDGMQQQQSKIDEIKLSKKYGMREESFYNGDVDAVKAGEISQDVVRREPLPVNDEEEFQTKQELKTPVTFSGLSSSSLASLELQSTKPTLLDTSITISEKEESVKTLSTVNLTPTSTNIHSTQMLDITPTQTKGSEQLTHPQDIVRMTSAVITSDNIASDASHLEKTKTETPDQSVTVIDGTSLPLFDYNEAKEMELRISSSELLSELSTEIQSSKPVLSVAKESTNSHVTTDEIRESVVNTKSTETAEQHTRVQDNVYLSSSLPEHESFFFTAKNKNITDEVSTGRIMPTVPPTEKPINTYTSSEFMSRKTLSYRSSTTFSTGNSQEKPDQEDKNSEKANAEETLQKPEYEEKHTADIPVHHESSVTNAKSFKEGDRADTETSPKVAQNIEIPNPLIHTAAADDNTKSNSDPAHTGEGSKTRAEKEVYTSTFQHNMKWLLAKLDFCLKVIGEKLPSSVRSLLEHKPFGIPHSVSIVFIIASPVSMFILLTCCCNSSGEKKTKKKDPLVIIRNLEEKLFITTKEKENLEDALQNLEEKFCDQEQLKHQEQSLETDLNRQKLQYVALQKKHLDQEKELEKFKKQDEERKQLEKRKDKEISELEEKVLSQQDELLKLNENSQKANQNLNTKSEELTTLKSQVTTMNDQIHHLEIRKQQLLDELEDWNEKSKEMSDNLQQTQCEYKQMQNALAFKDNEMEVLKECIMQLKSLDDESSQPIVGDHVSVQEKIQAMMDVSRVNATLKAVEEEREIFHNRLQIETESRKELEDQIEYVKRELESVHTDKMKADRQCQEAQTKLSVLTNYFKEKELEMQKELGEQEVLKKQNINKLATADEKAKMVEEELISYKQQVEDLKREILTAERDFRVQIATNEKKAHENWLATRAAERELKESRNQLGTLRQKLTSMDNRPFPGPAGLIRPLATRNLPPPGIMNGPPGSERFLLPHPADRPPFKGLVLHGPPPRMEDFRGSPIPDRIAPLDRRSLPPGVKMSPSPPHRGGPPPPPPPPPPPFDRRAPMDRRLPVGPKWVPPPHPGDRRSPSSRKSPPYSPPLSNATPGSQRRAPPVRLETPSSNRIDPSLRQGPHGSAFGRPPSPTASPQGRERPPRQHSQV